MPSDGGVTGWGLICFGHPWPCYGHGHGHGCFGPCGFDCCARCLRILVGGCFYTLFGLADYFQSFNFILKV